MSKVRCTSLIFICWIRDKYLLFYVFCSQTNIKWSERFIHQSLIIWTELLLWMCIPLIHQIFHIYRYSYTCGYTLGILSFFSHYLYNNIGYSNRKMRIGVHIQRLDLHNYFQHIQARGLWHWWSCRRWLCWGLSHWHLPVRSATKGLWSQRPSIRCIHFWFIKQIHLMTSDSVTKLVTFLYVLCICPCYVLYP